MQTKGFLHFLGGQKYTFFRRKKTFGLIYFNKNTCGNGRKTPNTTLFDKWKTKRNMPGNHFAKN